MKNKKILVLCLLIFLFYQFPLIEQFFNQFQPFWKNYKKVGFKGIKLMLVNETNLNLIHPDPNPEITHNYEITENFDVLVYYEDLNHSKPIDNARIDYNIDNQGWMVIYSNNGTIGYYLISVNCSNFITYGKKTMNINASKPNYENQSLQFNFYIKPPLIWLDNQLLINSSIYDVSINHYWGIVGDGTAHKREPTEKNALDIKYGKDSYLYFRWVVGNENDGDFYGLHDLAMNFKDPNGTKQIRVSIGQSFHYSGLLLYKDINNDSLFTWHYDDFYNPGFVDQRITDLLPVGNALYFKEKDPLIDKYGNPIYRGIGISSFKFYNLSTTYEENTTLLHWGLKSKIVSANFSNWPPNWNQNISVDYLIKFHFSAKNGVANLKVDTIFDNFTFNKPYVDNYGYCDLKDLKLARTWDVWSICTDENNTAQNFELDVNGYKFPNLNGFYWVNKSLKLKSDSIDIGNIDLGSQYLWNNTKIRPLNISLAYLPPSNRSDIWLERHGNNTLGLDGIAQSCNWFNGCRIEIDPEYEFYFQEKEKDLDDEEGDDNDNPQEPDDVDDEEGGDSDNSQEPDDIDDENGDNNDNNNIPSDKIVGYNIFIFMIIIVLVSIIYSIKKQIKLN